MSLWRFIFSFLFLLISLTSASGSPLEPLKLDHPRDTFDTYLKAMADYKEGLKKDDQKLLARLDDAARCFDLEGIPFITRDEIAKKAAIQLKEVIDRIIVIDLKKIPDSPPANKYWRLKNSEIAIVEVEKGPRKGQYLFSSETVQRMHEFYKKVKDLPYLEGTTKGAGYEEPWNENLPEWLLREFLLIKVWQWLGLFVSILLGLVIKKLTEILVHIFKLLTSKKEESLRHRILLAVEKPIGLIAATGFWFACLHGLRFEGAFLTALLAIDQIVFSAGLIWAVYRLSDVLTEIMAKMAQKTESDLDDELVPLVSKALRIFIVILGVLMSIQNLGFNVMSLVAGLGLGGLAFALAAKDTAANFFGSIMILVDRPFRMGDWIVTSGAEGNVESIGFRSTRIRTFYNSLVSVPNSQLANANIDNMGERRYRRCRTTLGVTYSTGPEKIEEFVQGIRQIIETSEYTRKDSFHVYFNDYGASSLDILLYFFLDVSTWALELEGKQKIYLDIMKLAKELGISFAFPTQSLHVESLPLPKS